MGGWDLKHLSSVNMTHNGQDLQRPQSHKDLGLNPGSARLALCPWGSRFPSLSLSFLICKIQSLQHLFHSDIAKMSEITDTSVRSSGKGFRIRYQLTSRTDRGEPLLKEDSSWAASYLDPPLTPSCPISPTLGPEEP